MVTRNSIHARLANAARPQSGAPSGWATLTPALRVADVRSACDFYGSVGFEVEQTLPGPEGNWSWAQLRMGSSRIWLNDIETPTGNARRDRAEERGPRGLGMTIYAYVSDLESVRDAWVAQGRALDTDIHDEYWGDRSFTATDPYGFTWTFATHVRTVSMEERTAVAIDH